MPTEPAQLSSRFGPDAAMGTAGRGIRRGERWALSGLAALCVLGVAAWQIPPMLDWSQTKQAIASYASARLGRRVSIGGQVHLTLLPHATLLADDVTLADRGDGISAKLGTLRLELSIGGLLAGRVVPQSLSIESPVVTLPWPLPRGVAPDARPAISREFAASMDGGTLTIAGVTARQVSARFHTDPDTGSFGAQGTALVAGLPWRFTALVGAPGRDGVSTLTLTLDGQAGHAKKGPPGAPGTGAAFHGRILSDGSIAGNVVMRGADLSQFGDGPHVAWQADGEIRGDGQALAAPALHLLLGASPGRADLRVRLASPVSVQLQAVLGTVPAGAWMWRLLRDAAVVGPAVSTDLDISAAAFDLPGGVVGAPHVLVSLGRDGAHVRSASADLPGGARIEVSGQITAAGPGSGFHGHGHLSAPDLRHTLRWLAAAGWDGMPGEVPENCDIQGDLAVNSAKISLSAISGKLAGSAVTGTMTLAGLPAPSVDADLALDRFDIDSWGLPGAPLTLAAIAAPFAAHETHIRVRAGQVAVAGLMLRQAIFDGQGGREGLTIHRLAADLPGGHLEASGSVGADGSVANGQLDLVSPDAAGLPAAWRKPVTLWHGPFHLALTGAGPPQAIDAQMRADLGDLRGEAEGRVDTASRHLTATVTLRHPGAPRLLDGLGLPGAEDWLGYGSLAVTAHLAAWPGHIDAQDFSVSAASLQLAGHADADLTGSLPAIAGQIDAATVVLPGGWSPRTTQPLPWAMLRSVQGTVGIKASRVLVGLGPFASDASADVTMQNGELLVQDARASVAGGQFNGQLAVDGLRDPPMVSVQAQGTGMNVGGGLTTILAPGVGSLDWSLTAQSSGYSPAALLTDATGRIEMGVHAVTVQGFDLAKAGALLSAHGPSLRGPLQGAMTGGATGPLDGAAAAGIADGRATFESAHLSGSSGTIALAGTIDTSQSTLDLAVSASPAVPTPPAMVQHVFGPLGAPQRTVNIKPALASAGQLRKTASPSRRRQD